jgi:hypothetical protein
MLFISKVLYDFSNITFLFNSQGIVRIGSKKIFNSIPWNQVSHLYYCKGYSGPLYAIFSPSELNKKNQKRIVYSDFIFYFFPQKNKKIFLFPVYTEKSRQELDKIFKFFKNGMS